MIDKKIETVIAKAKAFCEANYENGFDEFVECYSDADWLEEAKYEDYHEKVISGEVKEGETMTWRDLKAKIKWVKTIRADYAAECRASWD